jgi:predicted TPR repeat methyltransferase
MEALLAAPDAAALMRRLSELITAGRTSAARPLLAALRRLVPSSPRLCDLAALLAMREGRSDAALAELDAGLAATPSDASLYRRRAQIRHQLGDPTSAVRDAAEAVVLDPADPSGKALLGALLTELRRPIEAVCCLQEAVAASPTDPAFCRALAAAQAAAGEPDAAAATLAAGIATAPDSAELRHEAVLLAVRRQQFEEAVALAEGARRDGIADACLFALKAHALSKLARCDHAAEAYAEAVKLGPDDPYLRHLGAAFGWLPRPERASLDYLRAVFDPYADRFDAHLISLGYRIPGAIRAALLHHAVFPQDGPLGPVLDLGCGTGLAGVAVSDLPLGPLIGVDISGAMLAKAAAKRLYAALHEADIMAFLKQEGPDFAAILAADVLCYFGALNELMTAVARRLRPGGLFIASIEEHVAAAAINVGTWALGTHGRYAHRAAYLMTTAQAAGLSVLALENQVVRREAGEPVAGLLAVLQRRSDAG